MFTQAVFYFTHSYHGCNKIIIYILLLLLKESKWVIEWGVWDKRRIPAFKEFTLKRKVPPKVLVLKVPTLPLWYRLLSKTLVNRCMEGSENKGADILLHKLNLLETPQKVTFCTCSDTYIVIEVLQGHWEHHENRYSDLHQPDVWCRTDGRNNKRILFKRVVQS